MMPPQNHELVPVVLTLSLFLITNEDVVDYVPGNPSPRKGGKVMFVLIWAVACTCTCT